MAELVIPNHIAIIPDGNRRWAKEHGAPSLQGHKKGLDVGMDVARKIRRMGVHTLTVWAFSTENWQRESDEVSYLMKLYETFMDVHLRDALEEGVRVFFIGRRDRISDSLRRKMEKIEQETAHFKDYILNIALDYGGERRNCARLTENYPKNY